MLVRQTNPTWVVTAYFNPAGFRSRRENLFRFLKELQRSRIPVLVVEMLRHGATSEVDNSVCELISLPQADSVWQKESLLNIGARALPNSVRKIIWSDCDLVFERQDWLIAASELLDRYRIIQPFTNMVCLPPSGDCDRGVTYQSFCSLSTGGSVPKGFQDHGHPGFAWGARRELFEEVSLYDRALAGSADHLMAHAFAHDVSSACVARTFGSAHKYRTHFLEWASRAVYYTDGQLAAVPGRAYHLWHGRFLNRRYLQREKELIDMDYDPQCDVIVRNDGMLTLNPANVKLMRWAEDFFENRREDERYES